MAGKVHLDDSQPQSLHFSTCGIHELHTKTSKGNIKPDVQYDPYFVKI